MYKLKNFDQKKNFRDGQKKGANALLFFYFLIIKK